MAAAERRSRPILCVVGAGTAGLEGLLRARERLGPDAELRLIAPDREFHYRPMSADSPFRPAGERSLAIADVVAQAGATWVADRAAFVREAERTVLTRDGDAVNFDFMLLAPGSRSGRTLRQGHLWRRGDDPGFLDQILTEVLEGSVRTVAVAVPRGARWPLPAYELALILAWTTAGTEAQITLLTSENSPLGALGSEATNAVRRELDEAGVRVHAGVEAVDSPQDHHPEPADLILLPEDSAEDIDALIGKPTDPVRVHLGSGSAVDFDRLISLPTVVGPLIAGVASDAAGFIEVDDTLKVCGSERVWAAGGCLATALQHSALDARQADAAIDAIAAAYEGSATPESPAAPELTGLLLSGQRDRWLAENPVGTREPSTRCLWWPPGRAVGRMLAEQIAAWNPSLSEALPGRPEGLVVRAPVPLGCTAATNFGAPEHVSAATRAARLHDIENRHLLAIRRRERAADAELRDLTARLEELGDKEQRIVRDLQQHGYLLHHEGGANRPRA